MLSNGTLLKFLQSCITEQHCFQNWMSKFICSTLRYRQIAHNNRFKCGPGDIKSFWAKKQHGLRKLWFIFDKFGIYLHYFAPFPHSALYHSSQSSHYHCMTMKCRAFFNIAWSAHKIYQSQVMTWIGELLDLNLAEEWPFLSACWYFDNVFLLGHSGHKLIPSSPIHFSRNLRTSCTKSHNVE